MSLPSLAGLIRAAVPALVGIEGAKGAAGSGFVIDRGGMIVTNRHLVGGGTALRARLADGSLHPLRLVALHERADLALVAISAQRPLPALELAAEDDLEVGDWVVALGNPFGLGPTASVGIVGARGRSIGKTGADAGLIQTDAAINPGNSGGPLLDLHGRVVGIVSAHIGQGSGIGLAVPTAVLEAMLKDLKGRSP